MSTTDPRKYRIMSYSNVKKLKSDPGSAFGIESTPKFKSLLEGHSCPCLPSLVDVH